MSAGFPTHEIQATVGAIQDAEARWVERNDGFHPSMLDAGESLVRLLGALIGAVGEYRDDVDDAVREYARRK